MLYIAYFTENLEMKKLCARLVLRLLSFDQKQRGEDISVECLRLFRSNKTCAPHFTTEMKEQSKSCGIFTPFGRNEGKTSTFDVVSS